MAMPLKRLWCEKKTLRLIKEIKSRPCIWNPEHEDYNEKYSLATSWEEIATVMEMSESSVRLKWKILRDAYKKELKKSNGGLKRSWMYFDKVKIITLKIQPKNEVPLKADDKSESVQESEIKIEHLDQNEEIFWGEDPIPDKSMGNEDDFDIMFLKSLTPYLRELGPMNRLAVREKMKDILISELSVQNASRCTANKLDVKTKWKTLRDSYRKELKKTDDEYTSRWQYFDKLNFVVFKNQDTENDVAQMETDDEKENQQEYEVQFESLGQSEEIYWGEDPIRDKRIKEEDDFDVMFLKSLTPYLRELGPMRRLVVRSKMQDMLLNELAAQNAAQYK